MKGLILSIGIISLGLGLLPEPTYTPIKQKLRVHQIEHYKCSSSGCVFVGGEM